MLYANFMAKDHALVHAHRQGIDLVVFAVACTRAPSQAEMLYRHFTNKKDMLRKSNKGETKPWTVIFLLPQAAPSQAEALHKNFKKKKETLTKSNKADVVQRYGNAASGDAPDEALLLGQTEVYVEYDASGVFVFDVSSNTLFMRPLLAQLRVPMRRAT